MVAARQGRKAARMSKVQNAELGQAEAMGMEGYIEGMTKSNSRRFGAEIKAEDL
jgi:hypothetical protein